MRDNRNDHRNINNVSADGESTLPSQINLPPAPRNNNPPNPPDSRSSVRGRNSRAGDAFSRSSSTHQGNQPH